MSSNYAAIKDNGIVLIHDPIDAQCPVGDGAEDVCKIKSGLSSERGARRQPALALRGRHRCPPSQ